MTPAERFLARAEKSISTASLLVQEDDNEAACSRAYYAIFYAARAALMALEPPVDVFKIKTHKGLLSVFREKVDTPFFPGENLAKAWAAAIHQRHISDYQMDETTTETATIMVRDADIFVSKIKKQFGMSEGLTPP